METKSAFPIDSAERKKYPVCSGSLWYFPSVVEALMNRREGTFRSIDACESMIIAALLNLSARPNDLETAKSLAAHSLALLQNELTGEWPALEDLTFAELYRNFAHSFAAVAHVSWAGNEKHNPGQPLHHARWKSTDHPDCILRHLEERGGFDGDMRHSACLVWRSWALAQEIFEANGAPLARSARLAPEGDK